MLALIIAVMMGVSFPVMRNMSQKNKLRATTREVIALMKYARTEAVFGERTTEVFIDVEKTEYWLDLREPDPKTGEYNPKRKKKQLEQKRDLPQDIEIAEITTYGSNIIKDKIIAIDFYPDGTATPTLMTFHNRRTDSKLTVELLKSTGVSEVSAGTIEEKKQKEHEEQLQNPVNARPPVAYAR
jgi:Tfp pilus assembly protein FimT